MYQEKLKELKRQGLVGMGIGALMSVIMLVLFLKGDEDTSIIWLPIFLGIVWIFGLAGIVYGWMLTGRLIGGTILGTPIGLLCIFVLRVEVALLIGMFVYPIVLIYTSIRARRERKESQSTEMFEIL